MNWQIGDVVRFAHQANLGPDRLVTARTERWDGPFVEIEGMSGEFAIHLFVEGGTVAITKEDLANWFTYHTPTEEQLPKYKAIREAGRSFAEVIVANTPSSADQTAAVRKIREAVMTANQSIACGGK